MPPMPMKPMMGKGPQDIPENPQDDIKLVQQAKTLLQQAMDLLANIGPESDQFGTAFDQAVKKK